MTLTRTPVSIPLLGLSRSPICPVNTADSLESHLCDLIALQVIATSLDVDLVSKKWSTNADYETGEGALSLSLFKGKFTQDEETGRIDPVLNVDHELTFSDLISQGVYAEIGAAGKKMADDEVAAGVNFSALYRIAKLLEEGLARHFLEQQGARVHAHLAAQSVVRELSEKAEARKRRHEELERQRHERDRRAAEERAARYHAERVAAAEAAQAALRARAAEFGMTAEEADAGLLTQGGCKTPSPFETDYGIPMPAPYFDRGPFIWFRDNRREAHGQPRVFFDSTGARVPDLR